jgi:hypothetical protein
MDNTEYFCPNCKTIFENRSALDPKCPNCGSIEVSGDGDEEDDYDEGDVCAFSQSFNDLLRVLNPRWGY